VNEHRPGEFGPGRGRKGGRPKGMTQAAIEKAAIAEALYKNGSIPVKKIAEQLGISKTTLYCTFGIETLI